MKKITVLLIILTTMATAQLRIGVDASRSMAFEAKIAGIPISDKESIDGMGFTIGYEKMLLSLIGVGAEYTLGGDNGPNIAFGYGVAKIPVGLPTFRGIVRVGYSLPMEDGMDAGLAYGGGLRFKPPLLPIGAELLYTIHDLNSEMVDEAKDLGINIETSTKYSMVNLTLTYSF